MSTLTTEGVFDGIPSRKDLKKHEALRKRVVDCKNSMFHDVDKMKESLGDDFDFLMTHIKQTYFIKTFKEMFADQKPNPRYEYHPPEAFGSTYKRGQAGSHHSDLIGYLSNINDTIRSLCLLLRYAMENRQKWIDQKEYDDTFNKSERGVLRGENERLKAKNAELEKQLKKALNSKTTGEESDWDILGLVEDSPIEDVRRQYKNMAMIYHPNRVISLSAANQEKAMEKFKRINDAHESLVKKLRERAIKANPKITEEELSKYTYTRFGTSNPFIV